MPRRFCHLSGHGQQLFVTRIVFAEDHHLTDKDAGNYPQRVKNLREVNALR
jgi:hypothetical protein